MKVYFLLFLTVWLLAVSALAQDNPNTAIGKPNQPPDGRKLIGITENAMPDSKVRQITALYENGSAMGFRYIQDWAFRGNKRGQFSPEQIDEVRTMLVIAYSQLLLMPNEKKKDEKYTCITFFNGVNSQSRCLSGNLPKELQNVVDFVKAVIQKQQRSIYVDEP